MSRLFGRSRRSRGIGPPRLSRSILVAGAAALLLVIASVPMVAASGDPPTAYDGSDQTEQDQPLYVYLDAFDPEDDALTYSIVTPPTHGSLDDCSSGYCTYTPDTGFYGSDAFTWKANDGTSDSNVATFSITVVQGPAKIVSSGPLTRVQISGDLNCAVDHTGDSDPEFFGDTACGTLVAVGGTLYRPQDIPAGGGASPYTAFTPVSQSGVTGSGTNGDPYTIVTVVDLGTTGLRLTETDSYVVGQETYRTDVTMANTTGTPVNAILFRAGDCYLQESDYGFGAADAASGAVSCVAGVSDGMGGYVPGTRIEQWYPLSGGSSYFESYYSTVWSHIGGQTAFANECDQCTSYIDNGAGLSWNVSIPAGGSVTRSHLTVFSPLGVVPLTTSKVAALSSVGAGQGDTYTITVTNPNTTSASLTSISDTLPAGFSYVPGSTTGATTSDPAVMGQSLTWTGSFPISASGTTSLTFGVTVSDTPGTYTNQAGATAESPFTVVGTGPTAPVTVLAPAHLTLVKVVDNTGGGSAVPTAWTLSATGPDTISGTSGSPAVTDAPVAAGTYALAEAGGPTGYTAGAWQCTGGSLTGASLVLAAGETASCSITNTYQSAFLAHGAFVIGDQDASIGSTVTWWNAQWWKKNSLSGGPAPASFKGFAASFSDDVPVVGGTWHTGPGSSASPPSTVPAYMAVIVTSTVSKDGSAISGDIVGIVLVKTGPTFGTGTVVSILSP